MLLVGVVASSEQKLKQKIISDILSSHIFNNSNDNSSSPSKISHYIGYLHVVGVCLLKDSVLNKLKLILY